MAAALARLLLQDSLEGSDGDWVFGADIWQEKCAEPMHLLPACQLDFTDWVPNSSTMKGTQCPDKTFFPLIQGAKWHGFAAVEFHTATPIGDLLR